jgi:hypothetical protein
MEMSKMLDDMLERDMANVFGTSTNNTAGPSLTMKAITDSMERVRRIMEEPPKILSGPGGKTLGFAGIRIIESEIAVRRERIKTYPKRKARPPAHWTRMDKKWRKRYGFREVPQMYIFQANRDLHTPGAVLVHPSQAALLRNFK